MATRSNSRATHACIACREKKIQCDRKAPSCGVCEKRSINCNYPASQNRYLVSREKSCAHCQRRRMRCDRQRPCGGCQKSGLACEYRGRRGTSPALPAPLNISLVEGAPQPSEDVAETTVVLHESINTKCSLLGSEPSTCPTKNLHPNLPHIWSLYSIYAENVDPLIKLIHLRSFHQQLITAAEDLTAIDLDTETLLFAVYFAATTILGDAACVEKFKSTKIDLLKR